MNITNEAGISLPLAVWLLSDPYDYVPDENYISATGMMKPIRQIVLKDKINPALASVDLQDMIARALGHAVHDSVEKAWKTDPGKALLRLGYPPNVVERLRINPTDEELRAANDIIPVYIEQRLFTEFDGWKIGGKFDMVTEGILNDAKTTSAFAWMFGTRDDEHKLQGSIYRWLDSRQPGVRKIHEDFIRINYIFTDWQKAQAKSNPKYPQRRVETKDIPLLSLVETEAWIINRLAAITRNRGINEKNVIHCTDDELWMSDPQFKYYSDPAKTSGRSTRNFDNLAEANRFMAEKGGKGIVIPVPGQPKRCEYCEVFDLCSQREKWFS